MDILKVSNQQIPISIRKSDRARRLTLRMHAEDGTFELVVPNFVMKFEINRFLKAHISWIEKQWSTI
ncbi:M48 family metallopeptidase, partial [Patescibacteria group bacterium]|nr:M48 family metallopeptidase [Patescibacteria group bacterium]